VNFDAAQLMGVVYGISALLQGLGAPYRLYMDRTKRLIPGVY
jgi:hypothetical protein